jgi:hypothetical protein
MTPSLDTWGIVLAGYWNRMIFTPDWVGSKLFHQDNIETEIAILPVFPVIYRHPEVSLEASGSRLVFRPRADTPRALRRAEEMALTVLRDLPNTPLIGVGVNFSFAERNPPEGLLRLFNFADAPLIAQEGWEMPERRLIRKLTGEYRTMNLVLGYVGESVTVEVNFHTDTQGASPTVNAAAQAAIEGRTAQLKNIALTFLRNVYHLDLEEGGDNE